MAKVLNSRALAATACMDVIDKGASLDIALKGSASFLQLDPKDRGLSQELAYGVCRWYGDLDHVASSLLSKPIRNKDRIVHFILLVGLYQLRHINTPDHAAVDESVKACKQVNRVWAKNLINGCLRKYARSENSSLALHDKITEDIHLRSFPPWMQKTIHAHWGADTNKIVVASNQRPPMCLRVNRRLVSRDNYLAQLNDAKIPANSDLSSCDGIILDDPVSVQSLPNFNQGYVSVQDTAAQLACDILDVKPDLLVLDACAAPGGKTAHLLERTDNSITMHAMDVSATRCDQLTQTLDRLKLKAQVMVGDASIKLDQNNLQLVNDADLQVSHIELASYDRILIDAPCSGTGVIRRHPDIKHTRRQSDIDQLTVIQQKLLGNLWQYLKPGGLMLYMTCSILPDENNLQISNFLNHHPDAETVKFEHPSALDLEHGKQTLPGLHAMDGFYYCLLKKQK